MHRCLVDNVEARDTVKKGGGGGVLLTKSRRSFSA